MALQQDDWGEIKFTCFYCLITSTMGTMGLGRQDGRKRAQKQSQKQNA